jgi:hypothetical protein
MKNNVIDLSKSYNDNMLLEENKCFSNIIEGVIATGKVDDKYSFLLDTDNVANIILLSILNFRDKMADDEKNGTWPVDHPRSEHLNCNLHCKFSKSLYQNYFNNIGKMFNMLPLKEAFSLIKGFGMQTIVDLNLDETDGFKDVMNEALRMSGFGGKYTPPTPVYGDKFPSWW